jgi:hypothetical protein
MHDCIHYLKTFDRFVFLRGCRGMSAGSRAVIAAIVQSLKAPAVPPEALALRYPGTSRAPHLFSGDPACDGASDLTHFRARDGRRHGGTTGIVADARIFSPD